MPGLTIDDRGAVVLTTDDGYQIPLLPAPRDPDEIVDLLSGTEVIIDAGGETTITKPEGFFSDPIVGKFDPLVELSDEAPGLHRMGDGPDQEILIVYADGTAQRFLPAIQSPSAFDQAASAIPGLDNVQFNTDGSIIIRYEGGDLHARPEFEVEAGTADGNATPMLTQEGERFFFTDSDGSPQEFFVT